MEEKKFLDFSSIQRIAVDVLNNNEQILNEVRSRYKFFTVDEYQEVNPIQEELIQPAIDGAEYGIKSLGANAPRAREQLLQGFEDLRSQGVQAVVLGCTEIPLVIGDRQIQDVVIIDPTLILARALIRSADPTRLQPLA